ncbi:MAG: hypothetical protein ACRDLN_02465 [Solirubrobacteraceae bacterium]
MRLALLAALLAGSCAIASCGVSDPYQGRTSPPLTTATAPGAAANPTTAPSADADEAAPALNPLQRDAQRRAERAARAFLRTYLPYSYGQRPGSAIRAATASLRRELARQPPRVSPALAQSARPRVRSLRATGVTRTRVYVLAQIDDGQRRGIYATTLTVRLDAGRWLVSEVQ